MSVPCGAPGTLHAGMRLGKKPKKQLPNGRRVATALPPVLPPLPVSCDWTDKQTSFGMMLNDQFGDCAEACLGHLTQVQTLNAASEVTASDANVEQLYEDMGFNPADAEATDNGTVLVDLLSYVKKNGLFGYAVGDPAEINLANQEEVKAAIYFWGGIITGANLPLAAQDQPQWVAGPNLDGDYEPGGWGGHAFALVGWTVDSVGTFWLIAITWGAIKLLSWQWWLDYVDEAYVLPSMAWVKSSGCSPSGLSFLQLASDEPVIAT